MTSGTFIESADSRFIWNIVHCLSSGNDIIISDFTPDEAQRHSITQNKTGRRYDKAVNGISDIDTEGKNIPFGKSLWKSSCDSL
jgi:hypothetical protein